MTTYQDVEDARGNEARTFALRAATSARGGRLSSERQNLALHLARDAFNRQDFVEAETWALRALNDGPQVDTLCLLGDICQDTFDLKNALYWYELACACTTVRRFDDPSVRDNRQARFTAIRREIREEWVHRAPVRELNFRPLPKDDSDFHVAVYGNYQNRSTVVLVDGDALWINGKTDFLRTVVLDDDLEFISFRPDLKLPHAPNLPYAMWILPVKEVMEFGDVLLLSPRAAKIAARVKNKVEFWMAMPEDAKFGAFTGQL